jgi:quercetin dioxygenase-like cupin family protein
VAPYLQTVGDPREVVIDADGPYVGSRVEEHSLLPLGEARLKPHRFGRMASPLQVTVRSCIPSIERYISVTQQTSKNANVTLVYQHELPNVPGKSIEAVLVEYGPGGYSPAHTHAKSAFIYATVLEGAIRSQVNDGPLTTYTVGQSFSEMPGDRHGVSSNASDTEAAKLLAVFVVDTNETQLTTPLGS